MDDLKDPPWEGHAQTLVENFAAECRRLAEASPYDHSVVSYLMRSLAGELRDQGFSRGDVWRALLSALMRTP